ncbi:hypothetical protein BV22DRAFT_1191228 [Leucogyrophana mollusca]|uniref:Uncharacterized protein n=1 Tax=Leucogyrophana mollusca TaxID=85980 RepID=A0ACB8BWQ9_9AGAM|nr:hypothetical protein BV22DRAFT_1191228 [Leucogyrophana mollusca]
MSSARQWFSKRVHNPPSKAAKDIGRSMSTEKLPLHVDTTKSPPGFKFNTFAAVMGKKPKKQHSAFPIQDPPVSPINSPSAIDPPNAPRYTNRPPAKSISSTVRSTDESLDLRTPSDVPRDRISFPRSVLTLSDPDPFAAGAIALPHTMSDPARLSVYSDTSLHEIFASKSEPAVPFRHPSLTSSSSHSHYSSGPISPDMPKAPLSPSADDRSLSPRQHAERSERNRAPGRSWDCIPKPTLNKSGSVATLTDKNRGHDSPTTGRPPSRPRGYTESGSSRSTPTMNRPARNGSTPPSSATTLSPPALPRPLTRQLSNSRIAVVPPTAPPAHELPPPPAAVDNPDDGVDDDSPVTFSGSGSSSSISFASSSSSMRDLEEEDYYNSRYKPLKDRSPGMDREFGTMRRPLKVTGHDSDADIIPPQSPSNSRHPTLTHCLKKSLSHQTLQKPKPGSSSAPVEAQDSKEKAVRKQRSFHQSRLNAPPLPPLRHANSYTPTPSSASDSPSSADARRGNPPQPVRKRLFSGSGQRQPSTSTTTDEDMRSVFSLPTEVDRARVTATRTTASLLDEPVSDNMSTSTHSAGEYVPQHIMSPAEMLKVEACVQSEFEAKYRDALQNRQRGVSFTSASTPLLNAYVKEGLSAAPTSFPRLAPTRSASTAGRGPHTLPRLTTRPSTAQGDSTASTMSSPATTSPSSACPIVGLSPPPRARTRPHTAETTYNDASSSRRSSNVPFNPLTPPPPRKRNIRTSLIGERATPHKSMMRKPSFLDITDDGPSYEDGSFLDFDSGKESLDLSRGTDDETDIIR